jgi:hypothetical protein
MATKVCSEDCGRCLFDNSWVIEIAEELPGYIRYAFGDWLHFCPDCGTRLLPGGETEPREGGGDE